MDIQIDLAEPMPTLQPCSPGSLGLPRSLSVKDVAKPRLGSDLYSHVPQRRFSFDSETALFESGQLLLPGNGRAGNGWLRGTPLNKGCIDAADEES